MFQNQNKMNKDSCNFGRKDSSSFVSKTKSCGSNLIPRSLVITKYIDLGSIDTNHSVAIIFHHDLNGFDKLQLSMIRDRKLIVKLGVWIKDY